MRTHPARLGRSLLAAVLATAGLAAGATVVAAADPGPTQVPFSLLVNPGPTQCPAGLEVALPADPATGGLPGVGIFIPAVEKQPGPSQCPTGVSVTVSPGPSQSPGSIAQLPLTGADCAAGTASLQATADALGLIVTPPDPATNPGPSQCPAGDALMAALAAVIAAADPGPIGCPNGTARGFDPGPISRLSPGILVLSDPGPIQCPSGTALVLLPARPGLVRGALVLHDPGPIQRFFRIRPAGIAGLGSLDPGPTQ